MNFNLWMATLLANSAVVMISSIIKSEPSWKGRIIGSAVAFAFMYGALYFATKP